jgi:hypothetical protein
MLLPPDSTAVINSELTEQDKVDGYHLEIDEYGIIRRYNAHGIMHSDDVPKWLELNNAINSGFLNIDMDPFKEHSISDWLDAWDFASNQVMTTPSPPPVMMIGGISKLGATGAKGLLKIGKFLSKVEEVTDVVQGPGKALNFKAGFEDHLVNVKGIVRKGNKGVVGGHNLDSFKKTFADNGWNFDDCIIAIREHPSIKGIHEIEYGIPALDKAGNVIPGQLKHINTPKTIYDSQIIPDSQMINWGKEAMANGTVNGRIITGQASNGLKFQGYIDNVTGDITNFFPILE